LMSDAQARVSKSQMRNLQSNLLPYQRPQAALIAGAGLAVVF
jgi:hypothetical protein